MQVHDAHESPNLLFGNLNNKFLLNLKIKLFKSNRGNFKSCKGKKYRYKESS